MQAVPESEQAGQEEQRTNREVDSNRSTQPIQEAFLAHLARIASMGHQRGKELQARYPNSEYPVLAHLLYGDEDCEETK